MSLAENQKRWINSSKGQAYLNSDSHKNSIRKYSCSEKSRQRDKDHRDYIQKQLRAIKTARGCLKCGYNEHFAALDFHHRNPEEKLFGLAESRNYSWESVLIEVAKCDVMCRNCHAILEQEIRDSGLDE